MERWDLLLRARDIVGVQYLFPGNVRAYYKGGQQASELGFLRQQETWSMRKY